MKKVFLLLVTLLCSVFFSCRENVETPLLNEKILIKTDKNGVSEIKVVLEGKDGNCIDGAFVAIKSDGNDYLIIDYDNDSHCYYDKRVLSEKENINFVINSFLLKEPKEIIVPYCLLNKKPLLNVFYDEDGNSVLKGNKLDPKKKIQIAWNLNFGDCVYKVSVSTSLEKVYEVSTKSMTTFIPANVLESEKYYFLKIEAQKSNGDISFEKENYYSVSVTETESIWFTTK